MQSEVKILAADVGSDKVKVASAIISQNNLYVSSIKQKDVLCKKGEIGLSNIINSLKLCVDEVVKDDSILNYSTYINYLNPEITILHSKGVFESKNKNNIINKSDIQRVVSDAADGLELGNRFVFSSTPHSWIVDDKFFPINPINTQGNRLEADVDFLTCSQRSNNEAKEITEALEFNSPKFFPCIVSLQNAFLTQSEMRIGVLLFDFGSSYTNVIAYKDGRIVNIFTYPMGSRNVTNEIASQLNLSFEDAERIKRLYSKAYLPLLKTNNTIEAKHSYTGLSQKVTEIEISSIVSFKLMEIFIAIKERLLLSDIPLFSFSAGIVMSGGGALHIGVCELVESIFKLPVHFAIPEQISGFGDEFINPRYAVIYSLLKQASFDYLGKDIQGKNQKDKFSLSSKIKKLLSKVKQS